MDVEKFIDKAEVALKKRAAPQAIALYRQVLRARPGHAGAVAGLLVAFRRKAELKGGPSLLDKAAAKGLSSAASGLSTAKKWAAAVRSAESGLERNPGDRGLVAVMARSLVELGHSEAALASWQYRVDLDDGDAEALKEAGKLHYELRQIDEATECLERAHAIDRHDPEVERMRKHLAAEGTLSRTAYETATSSREISKDRRTQQGAGGQAARPARGPAGAAENIDRLAERLLTNPADRAARKALIEAHVAAGRIAEARAVVASARTDDPEDPALDDLAGDVELAANEVALRAAKGDAEASQRVRNERATLEAAEFGRRVDLDPSRADHRLRLARALYRLKQTDRAIEQFQAIISDPRFRLEAQTGMGACFVRKGLYPLAARQFEAALEGVGGVAGDRGKEICYHLGLVCERQGDNPGALVRYLEIYEVDINYKDVATKIEELKS